MCAPGPAPKTPPPTGRGREAAPALRRRGALRDARGRPSRGGRRADEDASNPKTKGRRAPAPRPPGAARRRGAYWTFAVSELAAFRVKVQLGVLAPPLLHTPDQITDRPLVALRVMLVPTAKLAEPVVGVYYREQRGRAYGLYNAIKGAGYVLSPVIGGAIVARQKFAAVFLAAAVVGTFAFVFAMLLPPAQTSPAGVFNRRPRAGLSHRWRGRWDGLDKHGRVGDFARPEGPELAPPPRLRLRARDARPRAASRRAS